MFEGLRSGLLSLLQLWFDSEVQSDGGISNTTFFSKKTLEIIYGVNFWIQIYLITVLKSRAQSVFKVLSQHLLEHYDEKG